MQIMKEVYRKVLNNVKDLEHTKRIVCVDYYVSKEGKNI
jgi:hypothetical protein